MYKVFAGEKCIIISGKETEKVSGSSKMVRFSTAEELHKEYKQFSRSASLKKLVVTGNEAKAWTVFRSLFAYIEAAGGVVRNEKGELLMIYRNKHWDLPKGKMEKGETSDQTALREVEEECGVKDLKITNELILTQHIFFQDKYECIKRTYWYEMNCSDKSKPKPQAKEGILKAEWMSKEEVKKVWNKIYPSLQDVITAASFLS
jgi:ADP-ribose pyrophosphatase YjhB (NUDIX family)